MTNEQKDYGTDDIGALLDFATAYEAAQATDVAYMVEYDSKPESEDADATLLRAGDVRVAAYKAQREAWDAYKKAQKAMEDAA
jgi:hypothetical protein